MADWRGVGGDAAVITGDIVNIALSSEFEAAERWLAERFDPDTTAFTPGNHDAYVPRDFAGGLGRLASFMRGERRGEADAAPAGPDDFPYLRRFGEVSLILANSSPPTAIGLASGALGAGQVVRIETMLKEERAASRFVALALHHPPIEGVVGARKGLEDGAALRAAVRRVGVDLIMHGHAHFPHRGSIETPTGRSPVIGPGSASHPVARGRYRPARYGLYRIARAGDGWRLDVAFREYDPATGAVVVSPS